MKKKAKSTKTSSTLKSQFASILAKGHWIIGVLAMLIYLQTFNYDFVLDDQVVYSENSFVQKGFKGMSDIFSNEGFVGYFGEKRNLVIGDRYRPLSLASFAVEKELVGGDPWIGHVVNAMLYGILVGILFLFMREIAYSISSAKPEIMATLTTGIFAFHPTHVEAIANIKGRDEILAGLFVICALWVAGKMKNQLDWKALVGVAVFSFLGSLSKEHAVTLVALVPLTEYLIHKSSWKKIISLTAAVGLGVAAYMAMRYQVLGYLIPSAPVVSGDLMNNPFLEMNGDETWGTIIYTWLRYALLLWFPYPLTHDYYPYHIAKYNMDSGIVILTITLYLTLIATAIWNIRKRPIFAWSLAFFMITLLPASNVFFTVGTFMNERFLFIPSIGFAAMFGWIFTSGWTLKNKIGAVLTRMLAVLFLILFLGLTLLRIPDWKTPQTLNDSAIKVSKNSARINLFVGTDHYNRATKLNDRVAKTAALEKAQLHLERALRIYPLYGSASNMLCGTCAEKFKVDNKVNALLKCFERVATFRPDTEYLLQFLDFLKGRGDYTPELIDFYRRTGYKRLFTERQNFPHALRYLREANTLNPGNAQLYQELSEVYLAFGMHLQEHPDPNFETADIIQSGRYFGEKARGL